MEQNLQQEEWRTTKSLPPHIEVSSQARLRKYINASEVEEVQLTNINSSAGISYGGRFYPIYRLMAEAFIPNPDNLRVVRHKNGISSDNRLENLEWARSGGFTKLNSRYGSRSKVYCKELDKVFGGFRAASYILGIPDEAVSESVKTGQPVCGLTFRQMEGDDPLFKDHNIFHLTQDDVVRIYKESVTIEEARQKIQETIGDGIKKTDMTNWRSKE